MSRFRSRNAAGNLSHPRTKYGTWARKSGPGRGTRILAKLGNRKAKKAVSDHKRREKRAWARNDEKILMAGDRLTAREQGISVKQATKNRKAEVAALRRAVAGR